MAIALTNLAKTTSATSPATSGSLAFTNGRLYIISAGAVCTAGQTATWDTVPVTTGGLTFVLVKAASVSRRSHAMWCAYKSSGVSTATVDVAVTSGGLTRLCYSVEEVTGTAATAANNGSDAFVQSAAQNETSSTSCSVTLSAFADAVNNVAFGTHSALQNAALTVDTSYTNLSHVEQTSISMLVEYILGQDTAVAATCSNTPHASVAAELKIATAGDSVGMIPIF